MTTPMTLYKQPGIYEIRSLIDNKFYTREEAKSVYLNYVMEKYL